MECNIAINSIKGLSPFGKEANIMKKQYKHLIIIIILLQFLLTGCGPGTEESMDFSTLEEFKENFAEYMAYPSYIPFEFDTNEDVILDVGASYNDKRPRDIWFKYISKKKYKRIDILNAITLGYKKTQHQYNKIYELVGVYYSFLPEFELEDLHRKGTEFIEHKGYTVYYEEIIESELINPEKVFSEGNNMINLYYNMNFDNKFYVFSFYYYVKEGTDREKILEIRDKVKTEALDEVIKSYESLDYENKN